ncbi:uncharacterized protein [Diabrotica undecimpunctata]|uniref:uncharacterized protein n=1 Tax=Diabrotica undecimpunctata TaxID=50387 RepID=UPI003B632A80
MPSKYKRVAGSRNYENYTADTVERALEAIRNGVISQRKAAIEFGVPVSTLKNRLKNRHTKQYGSQTIFTKAEEDAFTSHICSLSLYGFALDQTDLRNLVKNYLDRDGRTIKQFKDNLPGKDWLNAFLKRNLLLTQRFASNIKRSRAEIGEITIKDYFNQLQNELADIPANNIWNYDETNLSDDPDT